MGPRDVLFISMMLDDGTLNVGTKFRLSMIIGEDGRLTSCEAFSHSAS